MAIIPATKCTEEFKVQIARDVVEKGCGSSCLRVL